MHLVEIGTLLAIAYVIFRPLAAPRALPDAGARRQAAAELVREPRPRHAVVLQAPRRQALLLLQDRRAFVGYRIENGVLLLSGDPVGPPRMLPGLLAELRAFADARGLKLGAVGASERLCPLYEELGLRTIYLGDEAIIELDRFSLEGRPIRKVRQSVTRLSKAGFTAELHELGALDAGHDGRGRARARARPPGRSRARLLDGHGLDRLRHRARRRWSSWPATTSGAIRGVLHFVPVYGRPAVSLSFMRRDPETPNGLTEFLVARGAELLRERGLEEMSLNFAAFAKWMHSPERRHERVLGKLVALGNPFFQIESLYRFNAKFFPRWEPRYLVYDGALGLPRAGIAALWAEGQLWKPSLAQRARGRDAPRRLSTLPL